MGLTHVIEMSRGLLLIACVNPINLRPFLLASSIVECDLTTGPGISFTYLAPIRQDVRNKAPLVVRVDVSGVWNYVQESSESQDLAADSELLQKVTDYSTDDLSLKVTPILYYLLLRRYNMNY